MPELLGEVSTLGHAPRVIGVFGRGDLPTGTRDVVLALWQVADPGNVGTLLRTADAFGAAVALSDGCADPLGRRRCVLRPERSSACRSSRGTTRRIGVSPRGARRRCRSPRSISKLPLTLLLGSEREGLPDALVTQCHKATIRLPGEAESLNVAAAGAIALYELSRRRPEHVPSPQGLAEPAHRRPPPPPPPPPEKPPPPPPEPEFGGASALPKPGGQVADREAA